MVILKLWEMFHTKKIVAQLAVASNTKGPWFESSRGQL